MMSAANETAAQATKKSGKKKATPIAWNDFVSQADVKPASNSWADEEVELPTGPAERDSSYDRPSGGSYGGASGGYGDRYSDRPSGGKYGSQREGRQENYERNYDRPDRSERSERPQRENVLPDKPPFTAYVGNLAYETSEVDLRQFFGDDNILSIRIPKDKETSKPKGFCYVEFVNLQALVEGLKLNGEELKKRSLKVNVADQSTHAPKEDRTDTGSWRRDPAREPAREPSREEAPRSDRYGGDRDRGSGRFGDRDSSSRYGDRDSSQRYGNSRYRNDRDGERRDSRDADSTPQRPRLNLKPRSIPLESSSSGDSLNQSSKPKVDPFGGAKPVDSSRIYLGSSAEKTAEKAEQ